MEDIHQAAWDGDQSAVEALLDANPLCAHAADKTELGDDNTPLHYAAYNDHTRVVKLLLERGAKHAARNKGGATPLFLAAQQNRLEVVQMLLDAGADPRAAASSHGKSVTCVDVSSTSCVELLAAASEAVRPPERFAAVSAKATRHGTTMVGWFLADEEETLRLPIRAIQLAIWEDRAPAGSGEAARTADSASAEASTANEVPESARRVCAELSPQATSHTVSGLILGRGYRFGVRAVNGVGPGAWRATENSCTPCSAPSQPDPPRCVRVSAIRQCCRLDWSRGAPRENGSAITQWRLELSRLTDKPPAERISVVPAAAAASSAAAPEAADHELALPAGWLVLSRQVRSYPTHSPCAEPSDLAPGSVWLARLAAANGIGQSPWSQPVLIEVPTLTRAEKQAMEHAEREQQAKERLADKLADKIARTKAAEP